MTKQQDDLNTAKFWQGQGESYYTFAIDMEDALEYVTDRTLENKNNLQNLINKYTDHPNQEVILRVLASATKNNDTTDLEKTIDAIWKSAVYDFWSALALGGYEAPLWLFKGFGQGVGVKKDPEAAALFYGVASKLTPKEAKQVANKNKPVIPASMKPQVDALTKLIKETHKQIPFEGVGADILNNNWTKFNDAIKFSSGKTMHNYLTDKTSTFSTENHPSDQATSSHNSGNAQLYPDLKDGHDHNYKHDNHQVVPPSGEHQVHDDNSGCCTML